MTDLFARARPALLGLLLALAWATGAAAHAQLLATTPVQDAVESSAPAMAQLMFSEPVTALAIELIAPDGAHTDLLDQSTSGATVTVALPAGLGAGTHVLSWRIVSVDSHPVGGALIFSIGQPTGAAAHAPEADDLVSLALWASKVLLYVGLFFGVGAAVFSLAAPLPPRLGVPAAVLAGAGLVAAPLSLGLHGLDALGWSLADLPAARAWSTGAATSYGATVAAAAIALTLAMIALLRPSLRVLAWPAWAIGALALALSGHAAAAEPQWLTRPAVVLHALGILFWIGALTPLLLHLRSRDAGADRALAQFSRFIPFAVAPIVVSGVVLAAVQLGWPGSHWLSPYGFILAAKLGLLAALFSLAVWNRTRLTAPALAGEVQARHRLVLSIRAEIVLVLVILGLVGGWRFTPPPRALATVAAVTQAEPLLVHLMAGDVMAMALIDPGRSGLVALDIAVTDAEGIPLAPQAVTATLSSPDLGIEAFSREAVETGGSWRVTDLPIPVPGTWRLALNIRLSRFSSTTLQSDFIVP